MSLSPKSLVVFAVTAATAALLFTGQPAHAEDQRPCVSKREFYGARNFGIPLPPRHDRMTKVEPLNLEPIGRIELEGRWDVQERGVTVTHTLAGERLGRAELVRVKMYETCEHSLSELQVYVGFHKDTNLVLWTMWWPTRLT
jgi:hypothetical protein